MGSKLVFGMGVCYRVPIKEQVESYKLMRDGVDDNRRTAACQCGVWNRRQGVKVTLLPEAAIHSYNYQIGSWHCQLFKTTPREALEQ